MKQKVKAKRVKSKNDKQDTPMKYYRALKKRIVRLEQLTKALIHDVSKLWDRREK